VENLKKKPIKPFYKKWWFIALAILFVIGLILPDSMKEQSNTGAKQTDEIENSDIPEYSIINKVANGNLDNYYLLYKNSNSKNVIEKDAIKIKSSLCKGNCNIHLFNEEDSKKLYQKYPLSDSELIYVADRQIGTLSFTNDFTFYPLQDFKYKEVGGQNYQK